MTRLMRTLVPLFLLAVSVPTLEAQASGGPSLARATVGVSASSVTSARHAADPAARSAAFPRRSESSQNRAMMIVGAAALIVGAVIDKPAGTIIMIGGAGIGLYGLYKYLE